MAGALVCCRAGRAGAKKCRICLFIFLRIEKLSFIESTEGVWKSSLSLSFGQARLVDMQMEEAHTLYLTSSYLQVIFKLSSSRLVGLKGHIRNRSISRPGRWKMNW